MGRILYIEDDLKYADRLVNAITSFDFDVVKSIEELNNIKEYSKYDMLLADLYIESDSADELLNTLKYINLPIAVLSNTENVEDELLVFNHNIEEFISKASLFEVIEHRISNLINRKNMSLSYINKGTKYYLIDETNIVTDRNDNVYMLSGREFRILKYLLQNKYVDITREEIYWDLYQKKLIDSERRVVDVYINMLRNKLEISQIKSIRGVGYRWEDEIL